MCNGVGEGGGDVIHALTSVMWFDDTIIPPHNVYQALIPHQALERREKGAPLLPWRCGQTQAVHLDRGRRQRYGYAGQEH